MDVRLLLLEDDLDLAARILDGLRRAGFATDHVTDLAAADEAVAVTAYDGLVLDRTVPDGDSLTFLRALRRAGDTVPVLVLTARDTIEDRVDGFHEGADDYLVKPFAFAELEVRLRALTRRGAVLRVPVLRAGPVVMDVPRHEVTHDGVLLSLTPKEFGVLEMLLTADGAVVSRSALFEGCWDERSDPMSNVVDVVIAQLRRRLGEPDLIETVRGVGYRIRA
ncbi:response regulator transcription factor [Curtobacterium sp. MCBD17_019]|uniref:winged helix-turn-helix domain-containing protein n=1 Tax=Curtobacterium sp. MCBD17_019 TaxID=2175669 RepID=UPI0021AD1022